jgi:hypothetical protein
VEFLRVFVHPGTLDAEFTRKGGGVNQTATSALPSVVADQRGKAMRKSLDVSAVERSGCMWRARVRRWPVCAIHPYL